MHRVVVTGRDLLPGSERKADGLTTFMGMAAIQAQDPREPPSPAGAMASGT